MADQYFVMDDMEIVESGILTDFDAVIEVIEQLKRQDAVTIVWFSLADEKARAVTTDVARHWYDNRIRNCLDTYEDTSEIPEFVTKIIGDQEINDDWHAHHSTPQELCA